MKLSIADKLALLYTSAGSQRAIAAATGISHQTIGRILHAQMLGDTARVERYEARPDLARVIDRALTKHTTKARETARAQGLPFTSEIPIYQARMPYVKRDGEIIDGNRVLAEHMHWVSDRLRIAWVARMHRSGKFANVTVRSRVNLRDYNRQANARRDALRREQGLFRSKEQRSDRDDLAERQKDGAQITHIFTPRTFMERGVSAATITEELENNLQTRHAPATGAPGTVFAEAVYFQLDTRKHDAPDKPKARRGKGSARSRKTAPKARR